MRIKQKELNLADFILPLILLLYALMLINQGLTVTDTGYNYSNFMHFSTLDPMWKFSTFLSNALGAFFTLLPFGHTMLGLNFYTGLVKAGLAIMVYFFCIKSFQMNRILVFLAELMALGYCWCPTSVLYNYCTYFLFHLGAILLCLAVKKEQKRYFFFAGVSLGINVLVRLPNLAEMCLIAALWILFLFKRETLKTARRSTLLCVIGYAAGVLSMLMVIFLVYGPKQYVSGITQLLAMPSEAEGYSLLGMIRGDMDLYLYNVKWFVLAIPFFVVGIGLYCVKKEKAMLAKRMICAFLGCVMLLVFYQKGMFRFTYYNYDSIYHVGIAFLMVAGLCGLYAMFFGGKDYDFRMLGMVTGFIILITPLGSNNHLYSPMNNLFLVIPFVFECLRRWWIAVKNRVVEAVPILCAVFLVLAFAQGVLFGATFVFRDGISGEKRDSQVTDNAVLAGMWTNSENATKLNGLNQFLMDNALKGKNVILFDNVPAISFYMDLQPVLSTTWPDLDSFSAEKLREELQLVGKNMDENNKPLVISGTIIDSSTMKRQMLFDFMEKYEYQLVYSEEGMFVYR